MNTKINPLRSSALAGAVAAAGLTGSAQAIPTDALIHYDLNAVSGATVTNTGSLGSAADGTLQNATSTPGKFGDALNFTGWGSGVITNGNVSIGNAFTFACWVSTTASNDGYNRIITNVYNSSGYLGANDSGKYLTIIAGDWNRDITTSVNTSGAWHHLALTWDGTTQRFYYDGDLVSTQNSAGKNTTLNSALGFGCDSENYSACWNGKMDEAFVFGRALSDAELLSLYSGGATYTVTYDGNTSTGGSVPVDGATYATGATVTVLGNTGSLVKTGFVFTGWNTQADGLGTHYNPAATFPMGSANTTLYAEWKTPLPSLAGC